MEFFVPVKPVTKGNHRQLVRVRRRGSTRSVPRMIGSRAARAAETELVLRLLPLAPRTPLVGAVRLDVEFVLPVPVGFTKAEREDAQAGRLRPIAASCGDRGNFLKLLEDALQKARFVVNDGQFCDGEVGKRYAPAEDGRPGYRLRLQELSS